MRSQAKGRWVEGAIQSMLLPNRAAAAILHEHGATACTDVTGFGLLGHLIEMIQYEDSGSEDANPVPTEENAVEIWLNEVPALPGAKECIEAGIVSSLQPQVASPVTALLCTPQRSLYQPVMMRVIPCFLLQNVRCARAVANVEFGAGKAVYPLLFDPQVGTGAFVPCCS